MNIDATLKNADWPKRTPDKFADLAVAQKFEETQHPRDRRGRFTDTASVTVGNRQIEVVKPERAIRAGDKLVPLDVVRFDEEFQREQGFYIEVGGKGGIGERYDRFGQFLAKNTTIDAAEVHVGPDGRVGFTNGRHRYAWLRDQGLTSIPVAMTPKSVKNAQKHGYLAAVKLAWDESQHPRDKEGQFAVTANPVAISESVAAHKGMEMVSVQDLLKLRTENRRVEPKGSFNITEPTETLLPRLTQELREGGAIQEPLVVAYDTTGGLALIADGNTRLAAIEDAGFTHAPVVISRQDLHGFGRTVPKLSPAEAGIQPFRNWLLPSEVGLHTLSKKVTKGEYSYGNTQIQIAPTSAAAATLNTARNSVRDEHLAGKGKDIDANHVTVRFGLLNEDLDGLRSFIAAQTPFEAQLGEIELFPASEHSEGAVPVVARIISPELHAIEAEIGKHAAFKEKSFPEYKPHCTIAYCAPESAEYYRDLFVHGTFVVQSITISHQSGVQETIPFGMTQKWDESQHPRDVKGQFITLYHGTRQQHVESIRREGLKPGAAGLVWATESREEAQRFAEQLDYPNPTPGATVVEIRAPKGSFFFEKPLTPGRKDPPGKRVARFAGGVRPEWVVKRQGSFRWDESKHPRQSAGTSRGGEFAATLHGARDALDSLLNKEKDVSIQRDDVRRFLELASEQPEDPDLTDLQVEGMEIFGRNGLGIDRKKMPQIPPEHRQRFLEYAEKHGVKITAETVDPLTLKPTQSEISARRVGEKLRKYEKGDRKFPSVLVSEANRILDGHHHWGMMAAFALEIPSATMPIFRMHVSTKQALALMYAYMKKHHLSRATLSGAKVAYDPSQPRDKEGQWASTGALGDLSTTLTSETVSRLKRRLADGVQVYRGLRAGDRRPADPGDFGVGEYHSSSKARARNYGKVTSVTVTMQNPLVLSATEAYDKLTHTWDTIHAGTWEKRQTNAERLTKELRSLGYDGLAIVNERGGEIEYVTYTRITKADPATGRYVTPFVSFDKQGDEQLRMIASLNSSRLATWGFTAEAEVRGMARYRLTAVLDGRTSDFCRIVDGQIFYVEDAREKVIEVLNVQDPEDLKTVQPWPKQTKAALQEFREMSPEELTDRGLHIPPYHPHCRTICRIIEGSEGEEMDITPTLPMEADIFQPVTAADLQELGIDATPEQVAEWNEHIGMTPVELLSKFSGQSPQEVMTKGRGIGANPIAFEPEGIAFKARGESPSGVEFKLGALLDPFTGTYYLTQADLLAGSPKAELAFLKNLFSSLIDIGINSTATEVAVGVAGNAAYYAKLGFLPDELEWETLRTFALKEAEPMLASLAPEDRLLVEHLLQDKSVSALSALIELPFMYEGQTVGEWLFGEATGTWALDLTDEVLVAQARAYLA